MTAAEDRISYDPRDYGPCHDVQAVDEIVLRNCTVHIEMLDDDRAMLHLTDVEQGRMVRGHLTAVKLTPQQRRDNAARRELFVRDQPTAALLITVEDDEIGLGQ